MYRSVWIFDFFVFLILTPPGRTKNRNPSPYVHTLSIHCIAFRVFWLCIAKKKSADSEKFTKSGEKIFPAFEKVNLNIYIFRFYIYLNQKKKNISRYFFLYLYIYLYIYIYRYIIFFFIYLYIYFHYVVSLNKLFIQFFRGLLACISQFDF